MHFLLPMLLLLALPVEAQTLADTAPVIRRSVSAGKPFTVAGERGVLLGQQEGTFEAWVLPVKLLSHLAITANVEGYSVPIDLNQDAAAIEVRPDRTTITYAHIAFTLRQIMFAPDAAPDGTGAVALFQIDSTRPVDLTFSFTPEVRSMWPEPNGGPPSAEWVIEDNGGLYILHTDLPNLAGAVTIPSAQPGIMAPYQEKPQVHPLELKLHYDPKRDGTRFFPLLMAVGRTSETATNAALQAKLQQLAATLPELYAAHAARYTTLTQDLTSIETPDPALNEDFRWATLSIEQLKARASTGETGLVAGYYSSGDSARPGFGWFFGRDALYTLYAVNNFGDFALTRAELDFLIARQRADGKIMHEFSQTADDKSYDWRSLPYMYAAADATPLFLTQMLDYVRASGDLDFLRKNRAAVAKAWAFETAATSDTDHDGIYDNSQGTGWVESWPKAMPHQEIYLALFDQQASAAMAELATLLGDQPTAAAARTRATTIAATIEREYYSSTTHEYAFSRNLDGSLDQTTTVYPAVAYWNSGTPGLAHPEANLRRWASHDLSTDWGLRDLAETTSFYDPISYHQGSVWPLFTGWASIAEYRTSHPLAGYTHLMQTANLTTAQDLGAVTELLSGAYFAPFGRSTSHQLWSSAMVVVPALRGLFGIAVHAPHNTIALTPSLPADWDQATVRHLHAGASVVDLTYQRTSGNLTIREQVITGNALKLTSDTPGAKTSAYGTTLTLPLPTVEVSFTQALPQPGTSTTQPKILNETRTPHSYTLDFEAQGGTSLALPLRRNGPTPHLTVEGATVQGDTLHITFPNGKGYQPQTVVLRW